MAETQKQPSVIRFEQEVAAKTMKQLALNCWIF